MALGCVWGLEIMNTARGVLSRNLWNGMSTTIAGQGTRGWHCPWLVRGDSGSAMWAEEG